MTNSYLSCLSYILYIYFITVRIFCRLKSALWLAFSYGFCVLCTHLRLTYLPDRTSVNFIGFCWSHCTRIVPLHLAVFFDLVEILPKSRHPINTKHKYKVPLSYEMILWASFLKSLRWLPTVSCKKE